MQLNLKLNYRRPRRMPPGRTSVSRTSSPYMPKAAKPLPWRTPLPENPSPGQRLAVATIGCGQCHGDTLSTPRHGMAEVNGDFECCEPASI